MKRRIQKQIRELIRSEALGIPVTRRISAKVVDAALRSLSSGAFHIDDAPITDEVTELMMVGYVRRFRLQKEGLELSFTRDVRKMARRLDLDIDGINRSFTQIAKPRVGKLIGTIGERVNVELAKISAAQLPTREAKRRLRRRLVDMGIAPQNPSLVETLVRTHSQISFSAAQWQMDQNDPEGLITGYQLVTVGDNRVREEHALLDGIIQPKDSPFWDTHWPPLDFNCRCTTLTLTDPVEFTDVPIGAMAAVGEGFDVNWGKLLN